METAFWTAFAFIAYTYAGYPVLVWLLSRLRPESLADPARVAAWPTVAVVVAVHDEQRRVAAKIRNLRGQDYEHGKLRIVFVSDGSTDGTDAQIAREPDVTLLSYPERRGKSHALNFALDRSPDEVIVFSDARQELAPGAIRHLVARLLEPGIGAVSGELVHLDPHTHTASSIGLYWRYEKWVRKSESRLASAVGVTGALYAIRRRDYSPLRPDTILDDFVVPMRIARRGLRVVLESRAVIRDELQEDSSGERRRKIRTLTGNFQAFARMPWLFLPWENPLFLQFVSHKVFRLFVPYMMGLLLVASLLAEGYFYRAFALAQGAFYALAMTGFVFPGSRRHRLVSFAVVFLDLNWSAILAMGNFIAGRMNARWEKT